MFLRPSLDPKKALPAGLALLIAGMLLTICGIVWQRSFSPLFHLASGPNDFLHGFSLGLGLTLEAIAVVLLVRVRATGAAGPVKQ